MPWAILDEMVSLQVASRLEGLGYEVLSVAKTSYRGVDDQNVYDLARQKSALLITRDVHFTNPVRFPPNQTAGIFYITSANLRGHQEAQLVEQFLKTHLTEVFDGRLVFLSPTGSGIR